MERSTGLFRVCALIDRLGEPPQRSVERGGAMTRLLILIAIAFVIVSAVIGWLWRTYVPGAPLTAFFFGMTPVLTVLEVAIVVMTGVGVVGGLKRDVARVRKATIITVALGVLGAGYGELNTHFGVLYDSEITFATMAPLRIESLAMLALGLFGALPGLGLLRLRRRVR
ncbi:MAG: hypothetical protein EBR82_07760 [Caulobacteraceae bacterium]|nr:hypothetical protein [Caulobacteraceae bacterium]